MVKRIKAAVCDACGKTEPMITGGFECCSYETIPCGWEYRTRKELLCNKCAKAYERLLEEVKRGESDG